MQPADQLRSISIKVVSPTILALILLSEPVYAGQHAAQAGSATVTGPATVSKPFAANVSTPTIDASLGDVTMTLTGPTSPLIVGLSAMLRINLRICQDATGSRAFTWPAIVHGGGTVGPVRSTCSTQAFESFDGITLTALGPLYANIP